ncbi:hypothetical protein [Blastopirellula retiformator]|uniref:hypothetical protein n=1 Tax=Blastopirellula retiformator TaxID=2527970 RepID=UPI0011B57CD0|nr:hypothetical protein [Blastopirellula retiformator]
MSYSVGNDGGHDWHQDDQVNRDEGYATHFIANEAVRLIQARDKKKPLDGKDVWPAITQGEPSPHEVIDCNITPTSAAATSQNDTDGGKPL